jgi:hypothetical protein
MLYKYNKCHKQMNINEEQNKCYSEWILHNITYVTKWINSVTMVRQIGLITIWIDNGDINVCYLLVIHPCIM